MILLTGGCGYIGSHCVVEFISKNCDIIILDNFSNSNYNVINNLKKITNKNIVFYNEDINNDIDYIFKIHNIKTVIHFAAYKSVGESVIDPLKYYSNNIGGLISLLKAMRNNNVKNLIFSSSATVYGQNVFSDENAPTCAINPYGRTKLYSEEILKDVSKAYNINVICLRYFNPVGCHSSGLIGDDPKYPNNLFPVILSVIKGEKEYLSVYGNSYETSDGTGIRDYIHVMDLAEGHYLAYRYLENMNGFEVFNLGTGKGYSVLEIIEEFKKYKYFSYKNCEKREGDAPEVVANCQKSFERLNFKPKYKLKDMVESTINYLNLSYNK